MNCFEEAALKIKEKLKSLSAKETPRRLFNDKTLGISWNETGKCFECFCDTINGFINFEIFLDGKIEVWRVHTDNDSLVKDSFCKSIDCGYSKYYPTFKRLFCKIRRTFFRTPTEKEIDRMNKILLKETYSPIFNPKIIALKIYLIILTN